MLFAANLCGAEGGIVYCLMLVPCWVADVSPDSLIVVRRMTQNVTLETGTG